MTRSEDQMPTERRTRSDISQIEQHPGLISMFQASRGDWDDIFLMAMRVRDRDPVQVQ
jgi:hypothetical protein